MKKSTWFIFFIFYGVCLFSRQKVDYEISFENRDHHEAAVRVTFSGVTGRVLEVRMSRTSPGAYALFEFAKNVYNVKAFDSAGNRLSIKRPDQHQWNISGHDGTVRFEYTLFADYMDGTHSSITRAHVYLNVPSAFVWARTFEKAPVTLALNVPFKHWTVVTQLEKIGGHNVFSAPGLDYFIDSPIAAADFTVEQWDVKDRDLEQKIILAVNHTGSKNSVRVYAKMVDAVIKEQAALFGQLPRFDFGSFSFIANYIPAAVFDAMEHRNSTVLTSPRSLGAYMVRNLRTLSHEFIHVWNGERLRPAGLEPFSLEKTTMCDELWFVEGITTYYQDVIVCRTGLFGIDDYGSILNSRINYVYTYPGNQVHSLVEMSRRATLFDGRVYKDRVNYENTYISYYSYGAVMACALDFILRTDYGQSLDDYVKLVWAEYGIKGRNYTNSDLEQMLARLSGDGDFARRFFADYIYGNRLPDLKPLLENAGLVLRKKHEGRASLGRKHIVAFSKGKALIDGLTMMNEPLYRAGLENGDVILELDQQKITSEKVLDALLSVFKPGDTISIKYKQKYGGVVEGTITLGEDPEYEIVPFEVTGQTVSAEINNFRTSWLGAKNSSLTSDLVNIDPATGAYFPFEYTYSPYTGKKLQFGLKKGDEQAGLKETSASAMAKNWQKNAAYSCRIYPFEFKYCPYTGEKLHLQRVSFKK